MAQGTTKGVPIDIDPLLAANSDLLVPSQKAIKTYVDTELLTKQGALTLTTTGTSGASTLVGNTLNIPQYQAVLTNPITGTGTINEIAYFNATGSTIASLPTATYPSLTELSYVKGVTSAVQTQLNSKGYTLTVTSLAGNLSTGQTYYFGNLGRAPQLNAPDISRVYIPKTGIIKKAYIVHGSTSTGTITSITVSIRLNNTTDTLVAVSTANALFRTYINNSLSISVTEGDYIEIKVTSVSSAAPASNSFSGTLYIE
jgi:hypothetical protein